MRKTQVSLLGTILGAGFWGLSGTAAQALFQIYQFPVVALVAIRTLASGLILLIILRPARPGRPFGQLLGLSIFGFAGSQLAYLWAIQFSNAATATLLQFLFLPIVAGYEAVKGVLRWSIQWTVSLLLAMVGTLFLVGGLPGPNLRILVTPTGVLFGLLAAVSGAYYTLASRPLVRAHGSWWVTTWGFMIGAMATLPFGVESVFSYQFPSTLQALTAVAGLVVFVIVFGDNSCLWPVFGWFTSTLGYRDRLSFLVRTYCRVRSGLPLARCNPYCCPISRWSADYSGSDPACLAKSREGP